MNIKVAAFTVSDKSSNMCYINKHRVIHESEQSYG